MNTRRRRSKCHIESNYERLFSCIYSFAVAVYPLNSLEEENWRQITIISVCLAPIYWPVARMNVTNAHARMLLFCARAYHINHDMKLCATTMKINSSTYILLHLLLPLSFSIVWFIRCGS